MTRAFTDQPLDGVVVDDLLDIARRAPSAGFSQGVHFLVLRAGSVARFWDLSGAGEWFDAHQPGVRDAPVIIVPVAHPQEYTSRYAEADKQGHGLEVADNWPVPFWLTDAAMAVQNLLLLAEERGLGALWFGLFGDPGALIAELGAPPGVQLVGAVALGHRHPDDRPSGSPTSRGRRRLAEVVHHDRW